METLSVYTIRYYPLLLGLGLGPAQQLYVGGSGKQALAGYGRQGHSRVGYAHALNRELKETSDVGFYRYLGSILHFQPPGKPSPGTALITQHLETRIHSEFYRSEVGVLPTCLKITTTEPTISALASRLKNTRTGSWRISLPASGKAHTCSHMTSTAEENGWSSPSIVEKYPHGLVATTFKSGIRSQPTRRPGVEACRVFACFISAPVFILHLPWYYLLVTRTRVYHSIHLHAFALQPSLCRYTKFA